MYIYNLGLKQNIIVTLDDYLLSCGSGGGGRVDGGDSDVGGGRVSDGGGSVGGGRVSGGGGNSGSDCSCRWLWLLFIVVDILFYCDVCIILLYRKLK